MFPVRDELVGVLAVRRRRVRGTARVRGSAGVLPRGDLHRVVDLRMGSPPPSRPPREHLDGRDRRDPRSEEHTSELQSLMRNSYAVLCLKKKNKTKKKTNTD